MLLAIQYKSNRVVVARLCSRDLLVNSLEQLAFRLLANVELGGELVDGHLWVIILEYLEQLNVLSVV